MSADTPMTDSKTPELPDFSKATPRPWVGHEHEQIHRANDEKELYRVADFFPDLGNYGLTNIGPDEAKANMELALHAVNSYDETQSALAAKDAEIERLREALAEIERLYYHEGKDATWRAAQMRAVATKFLTESSPDPNSALIAELREVLKRTRKPIAALYADTFGDKQLGNLLKQISAALAKQGGSDAG